MANLITRALGALTRLSGASVHFLPAFSFTPQRKSTFDILAAYSRSPFIRAVAGKVADVRATAKWFVRVDGERLDDHPALDALMRPTALMDTRRRDRFMGLTEDLIGEAAAMILTRDEAGRGEPLALAAFPPGWITALPSAQDDAFTITTPGAGRFRVARERVLFRRDVDPLDPFGRGAGIGHALADEITVDENAAIFMSSVLANRGRPDLIVYGKEGSPLNREAVERFRERFAEHQGPERAGLPMFTAGPVGIEKISQTWEEMELVSVREFELSLIQHTWGIPPELIGKLENSNRATIDAADYLLAKHTILPRLLNDRAALNAQFAPRWPGVTFDFESPVQEDRDHARQIMLARPDAFTLNEFRASIGLDPLPRDLGDVVPRSAVTIYTPAGDDDPEPQRRAAIRKAAPGDIAAAIDAAGDASELRAIFDSVLSQVIAEFGADTIDDAGIGIDFNLFDPAVRDFLAEASSDRVTRINETTRDRLREALAEAIELGESTDQIVARIQDEIEGATPQRARVISRTEIVRASNFATFQALRQAGVPSRQWLATQDDHVRDSHAALDGMQAIMDQPFSIPVGLANAGATADYPGDFGIAAEDINCRCAILPVFTVAPEQRGALWKAAEAARAPHERAMESLVRAALTRQISAVAEILRTR